MNRPLRFGINALYLIPGGVGGTEIYLRNLLKALAAIDQENHYYVFINHETDRGLLPAASNFHEIRQAVRAQNRPARLIWEQTILPMRVHTLKLDCLLNPGFTAPGIAACPNVTVFHDMQHKVHPEFFRWFDKPAWEFFLWVAARRSRYIIASSDRTHTDVLKYYKPGPEQVRTVLLGVEEEFFCIANARGPIRPYLLCASTLHPHKNIERLVRVFGQLLTQRPEYQLVLAGMRGFQTAAVESTISELGLNQKVRITGWIPRLELYQLFQHAAAFVYPSTFEGFGLPVVEAMAAGVPLACSNVEPLRSLTGNAAVHFSPTSEEEMLSAIQTVLDNPDHFAAAGRAQARQFTWTRCAEATLRTMIDAAQRSKSSS